MEIAAANYTSCSRIDRQAEKIASPAAFTCDDPVTSSHLGMSDATEAISLCDSDCFRTVDAMHSSNAAHVIAMNGDALRMGARDHTWRQVRKKHGNGHQSER